MKRSVKTGFVIAMAGVVCGLTACGTPPTREDRMKSPQTAMRGPAYKRLIVTFNEAHQLAVKAADFAAETEAAGGDPETVLAAQELADDAARFADECEWFLANRRRMQWHQTYMNKLWVRFDELDPDHRGTVLAYTEKDTRKPTLLFQLKRDYNEQWDLDYGDQNFGDLFYPVGAKLYPGNPWEHERAR